MIFVLPWAVGLSAAAIHVFFRRASVDRAGAIRIFFVYQLVFGMVPAGLFGFLGHAFSPEAVASRIGWPAHPQFQFELASFELGIAVAALLGLRIRDRRYWLGMAVAPGIFFLLAGLGHLREMGSAGNFAPYNLLAVLPDVLLPVTLFLLLALLFRAEGKPNEAG